MSLLPNRGDRPSLPHKPPAEHQLRLKLHVPPRRRRRRAKAERPWSDDWVATAFVDPEKWEAPVARVRVTVPMTLATWPETTQYPLDGPAPGGGV